MARRTPFYEKHQNLNAKIVDFAGYEMPLQYDGIRKEHRAVRSHAGLFDVSHMGEFFISGPEALNLIQKLTINDVTALKPGKAQYSAMCYPDGGLVDDLLVYMLDEERYMLVVNAANIMKDREWILRHHNFDAGFQDKSGQTALLALQGPASVEILQSVTEIKVAEIPFYSFKTGSVAGCEDIIISATGYTGEKGFELYADTDRMDPLLIWDALFEGGKQFPLQPAGLGARDTLRLEMGYALYGADITRDTTPLEGGLGWLTRLDKGEFIGSGALRRQKEEGLQKKFAGFVMKEKRHIPRAGYNICDEDGTKIGQVTSGTQSVSLGIGIGMGYLPVDGSSEGNVIYISIRGKLLPAVITKPPFVN